MHSATIYIGRVRALCPGSETAPLAELTRQRRQRVAQMKGEQNRCQSIAAGLLLRRALQEAAIPCTDASFQTGPYGKPHLKQDGVFFNLSHAGEYVVCALADCAVGVDVEQQNRFLDRARNQKLAARILTAEEAACWEASGCAARSLLRFWTRKESYVKMTGEGLRKELRCVDTLHGAHYGELTVGEPEDRYGICVCTREDNACDFLWKMLD